MAPSYLTLAIAGSLTLALLAPFWLLFRDADGAQAHARAGGE